MIQLHLHICNGWNDQKWQHYFLDYQSCLFTIQPLPIKASLVQNYHLITIQLDLVGSRTFHIDTQNNTGRTLYAAILLYRFSLSTSFGCAIGTDDVSLDNTTFPAQASAVLNNAALSSL